MNEADRLKFAIGALELRRACDPGGSPEAMLDRVFHILGGFVPFDIATFAEYAIDRSAASDGHVLVLGRYAVDCGTPFNWPARWLKVPAGILQWISGDELTIPSVEGFFGKGPEFDSLRDNPVTQEYVRRNAQSFVVSVLKKAGEPVVSLTLARKNGRPFTSEHQRILEQLGLSEILSLVRAAYEQKSAAFHQEIRALFSGQWDPAIVAQNAVKRLCEHYRWDYAALFRLAHARGRFELVQQHNASSKRLLVQEGYVQSFQAGVLGEVLKTKEPVRVEDTLTEPTHGYIRTAPDARSCLCYPILLDGDVEWILDCESSEVGAFQLPDEIQLGTLIREAQNTVALWFEMRLNRALIDHVEQGLIVVDQANRITRMNALAGQLLGATQAAPGSAAGAGKNGAPSTTWLIQGKDVKTFDLADFGANDETKAVLASGHVAEKPVCLRAADGFERSVVASSRDAEDAFNRRIWRLTDPKGWDWVTALEYMRVTVQGVAQQTRGPLLLANALVDKARGLVDDPDLRMLLSKARASLSKTDITYERLVAGFEVEQNPRGNPVSIDLGAAFARFIGDLPDDDRKALPPEPKDDFYHVWVDPDRLRFVLHSTLGYLLAIRAPAGQVSVEIKGRPTRVEVTLSTAIRGAAAIAEPAEDADPLARAKLGAQEATSHALSTVRKVIECTGGTLDTFADDHALTVQFTLPTSPVVAFPSSNPRARDA